MDQRMTDWSTLEDACGSAEHVPELLERFTADPDYAWSELMDHLCPQLDTAFSASFAALPQLARLASSCVPEKRQSVLLAAGAIMACAPTPTGTGTVFEAYAPAIAELHRLADQGLRATRGEESYLYLLQALLSFEGVEVWDRCLDGLHAGEYEVTCPYCGVDLFIVISPQSGFSASDDYSLREVEKAPLTAIHTTELDGLGRRLHDRANEDGQERIARCLLYLFGYGQCPDCTTEFSVPDRITANW